MTDKTELYRQIHPNFLQDGRPTYIAFRPFPKDEGHLSLYDGGQISAKGSFDHYTQHLKCKTAGVLAVSVQECRSLDLPPHPSPEIFQEHAHLDFKGLAKKQVDGKSKALLAFALARDWAYKLDG